MISKALPTGCTARFAGVPSTNACDMMHKIASQSAASQGAAKHEEQSAPVGEHAVQELVNVPKEAWPNLGLPPFNDCKEEAYWGVTFTMRLPRFRWNPIGGWIELLVSFQMCTSSDIPANAGTNSNPRFAVA